MAFTLVELLVVIGIIALLVGILLPALSHARQQANLIVCQTHMRQLGQAIALYVVDNQGTLPYGYWNGGTVSTLAGDWSTLLVYELNSRYGTSYTEQSKANGGMDPYNRGIFLDVDTVAGDAPVHYSCHPRIMPDINNTTKDPDPTNPVRLQPAKLSHIQRSAEIIMLMDGAQWQTNGTDSNYWGVQAVGWALDNWRFGEFQGRGGTNMYGSAPLDYLEFNNANADNGSPLDIGPNTDTANNMAFLWANCTNGQIRFRHMNNKAGNFLFCDGHVESHTIGAEKCSGQLHL